MYAATEILKCSINLYHETAPNSQLAEKMVEIAFGVQRVFLFIFKIFLCVISTPPNTHT